MLSESNAPKDSQPWVRDVTTRTDVVQRAASRLESNAYSLAASAKSSYALISDRIANVDSFTTGLFAQETVTDTRTTYPSIVELPTLYTYADGDFQHTIGVLETIPFAKYDELVVTADMSLSMWSTTAGVTGIGVNTGFLPMIFATVPPLATMSASGVFNPSAIDYGDRWPVENFAPFLDYEIPGNTLPSGSNTSVSIDSSGYHPAFSNTTQTVRGRDNYTNYSMRYTRAWLSDYMEAIAAYATVNSPLPPGAYYFPPDVDQVEILLAYQYRPYLGGTTNTVYINSNRLSFTATTSFSLEGVRNLGY